MGLLSKFGKISSAYGSTHDRQESENKGIISSIYRNIEDEDELVHRFPYNNISTGSVLTVQTGQTACFYINGQLADVFTEGRYVLDTANIPGIQHILNLPSAGDTTFQSVVYFVSLIEKRNVLWGAGGMRIIDPYFEIPIKLSSRGMLGFKISNASLFIQKFISTLHDTSTDKIYEQFRSDIVTEIKVSISKYMKERKLNINELSSEYIDIASFVKDNLSPTFSSYGVELCSFNIEGVDFDEEDPGYVEVMNAIAMRKAYEKKGDFYDKERQYDIMQTAAGNEGAGVSMSAGMGLGMGLGMGNMMGNMMTHNMSGIGQQNNMNTPPPPPPATSFYIAQNGQTAGPFTLNIIIQWIQNGQADLQTYLCAVGSQQWIPAGQIPAIASFFGAMPPPPPPSK